MSKETAIRRLPRLYIREHMEAMTPPLTSEQLAERIDRSTGTVSKLLNGKMKMQLEYLGDIAAALGVEVPQLFTDPRQPKLDDLIRDLPQDEVDRIFEQVQFMVRQARARLGTAA